MAAARRVGVQCALGIALCVQGRLTPGARGIRLLNEAVAALEPTPARLELARAVYELGRPRWSGDRRGAAREPLRRSMVLAHRCGSAALAEQARRELVAAGWRPDPLRARPEQDSAFFTVAAFTGLRLAELRALRWSDLDFGSRLVHVRRSYTRGRFKLPKSGRVRSVPLIDQVIPPLNALSRREHFTDPEDLVFVNDVGDVIEESALRRRFYKALNAAELKRVRLHDLRHSYGSLAVQAYRLDEVKAYMGHADIAMTMRYVHFVPAHDAADRLSAVVAASHQISHQTGDLERKSGNLTTPQRVPERPLQPA